MSSHSIEITVIKRNQYIAETIAGHIYLRKRAITAAICRVIEMVRLQKIKGIIIGEALTEIIPEAHIFRAIVIERSAVYFYV